MYFFKQTKPHTKNEVRANLDLVSSGSIQESIIGGCDRDSDPKLIYSTAPDDNTIVSSKKKVSTLIYVTWLRNFPYIAVLFLYSIFTVCFFRFLEYFIFDNS